MGWDGGLHFSGDFFSMTWKRVATGAVLIPFVVSLVVWGSTAIVALAVALVTMLALFEYFALGEAIGHRAYRFWTTTCSIVVVFLQWRAAIAPVYQLRGGLVIHRVADSFALNLPTISHAFFLFFLGIASISSFTKLA